MLDETVLVALARRRGQSLELTRAYAERRIRDAVRDGKAGIYQTLDNIEDELRAEAAHRLNVARGAA